MHARVFVRGRVCGRKCGGSMGACVQSRGYIFDVARAFSCDGFAVAYVGDYSFLVTESGNLTAKMSFEKCSCLDLNPCPLVSEVTTVSYLPHQLPCLFSDQFIMTFRCVDRIFGV